MLIRFGPHRSCVSGARTEGLPLQRALSVSALYRLGNDVPEGNVYRVCWAKRTPQCWSPLQPFCPNTERKLNLGDAARRRPHLRNRVSTGLANVDAPKASFIAACARAEQARRHAHRCKCSVANATFSLFRHDDGRKARRLMRVRCCPAIAGTLRNRRSVSGC